MSASSLRAQVRKKLLRLRVAWARKTRIPIQAGLVIGCLLVGFGAYGLYNWFHTTKQGGEVTASQTVTGSTDRPDETPIKDYKVAADQPRQITIPAIQAKGFIQKVGTDPNNAIAVPGNVHLAGWYTKSPKPGAKGVSIVAGHLQGRYMDGVFRKLAKVKTGDEVTIEYGDRSKRQFIVRQVDALSIDETSKAQYENITGTDTQLTLVTCGGAYNRQEHAYEKRIVVRASLKP